MRSVSRTSFVPEQGSHEESRFHYQQHFSNQYYYKPKYHTIHRTDVSRMPTLDHLRASFYIKPITTNHYIKRELTVEPVTFREDYKRETDNKSLCSIHNNKTSLLEYDNRKKRPSLRSSLSEFHLMKRPPSCYNTFDQMEDEESLFYYTTAAAAKRPLTFTGITSVTNVLATEKQLMFDIHVKARNSNAWNIHVSQATFNVYATSNNASQEVSSFEHLGTIDHLNDPFLFKSSSLLYFKSKSSISTSQMQIIYPGRGDPNDRWPQLIRSPFKMAITGIIYHKPLPFYTSSFTSSRMCHVMIVDPILMTTKEIEGSLLNEQI